MKVNRRKCATCPWRANSPYAHFREQLEERALAHESRICHSTGSNAINAVTGKPEALCRGARDAQLAFLHGIGFLDAATDSAWNDKCRQLSITPNRNRKDDGK
jgi:hypothetical protein